ncbi:MAG TPA: prenyltransferase, partial [Actinophytocola sp.]|nr:prenyltransferase [Actinophytocola sp.]
MRRLFGWLDNGPAPDLPDTVAVEYAVPGLIAAINERLAAGLPPALAAWRGRRLAAHPAAGPEPLEALRRDTAGGTGPPATLVHSLEIFGAAARGAPGVRPRAGTVGCSPAATAAWLGDAAVRARRHPCVSYLERAARAGGVPVAGPLAVFERAWVLVALATAGLVPPVADPLVDSLEAAFGERGVAGGPGLPPDADDTATALYALALVGRPRCPDLLLGYRDGDHFASFPAERTASTSTNAHVLQAFGAGAPGRHRAIRAGLTDWLCGQQEAAGCWWDKWHASPYYATAHCAAALAGYGGPRAGPALRRATDWVLGTQRADGSWGRWRGTYEETAYAVRILTGAPAP